MQLPTDGFLVRFERFENILRSSRNNGVGYFDTKITSSGHSRDARVTRDLIEFSLFLQNVHLNRAYTLTPSRRMFRPRSSAKSGRCAASRLFNIHARRPVTGSENTPLMKIRFRQKRADRARRRRERFVTRKFIPGDETITPIFIDRWLGGE